MRAKNTKRVLPGESGETTDGVGGRTRRDNGNGLQYADDNDPR